MSVIRQRSKNLFVAWFIGVLMAVAVMVVIGLFFKVGPTIKSAIKPEVTKTYRSTLVATRPIQKGSLLDEDDMAYVMVEETAAMDIEITKEMVIGKKVVIDVEHHLPLTLPMVQAEEITENNQRLYEFDFLRLPYILEVGDVIDVRITFPNGQDYVVLAKKRVGYFERAQEDVHKGLLGLQIEEEESLSMSSAMVDVWLSKGARAYLVKYIDPLNQVAAEVTYPMNQSVLQLFEAGKTAIDLQEMLKDRMVLDKALEELFDEDNERFSQATLNLKNEDETKKEAGPSTEEGEGKERSGTY